MQIAPDIQRVAESLSLGQHKKECPECQGTRSKNTKDKPLSISVDSKGVQYHCHHCDTEGGWVHDNRLPSMEPMPKTKPPIKLHDKIKNISAYNYLKKRHIADEIIEAHAITGTWRFNGKTVPAVGFPYRTGDRLMTRNNSHKRMCAKIFSI